jgi:hypothetical protein
MKEIVKRGATSNIMRVFLQDSTSTTGAGKTGLLFSTTGLIIATITDNEATATAYTVTGSTIENITTLGTFAAPTATKCRFKEVDATNFPGVYEIHIADARYAVSNSTQLLVSVQCTGVAPVMSEVQLVAVDLLDTVRLGLTSIPNVVQGTTGSLPTGDASGRVTVITNSDKTGYSLSGSQTFNVTGNITGNVTGSVGSVASGGITSSSFATDSITATAIAADAITSAELSASAVQEIADGVLSRKLNMAGNISDVSVTSVSSATFTGANTYIAGDAVQFITTAPTSFALATKYYVIATSLTATTFQLSATSGGSAITTVSTGAFTVLPIDDRTVRSALRYVRNKVSISGSTMTVSIEDDATSAWTAALTTSPGVDPVTTLDPA